MAKITLNNLSHSYITDYTDADLVLRDVNIDWKDGGAYALLGPSGCGKTTLLNIISGLIKPSKGDILFDESSFKIYVDSNSFEFLKGSEVDFVSTGLNQGIIFNNPNAKVTCGCGESFSI